MERRIRITVVGDGATGKTSMLILYKDRKFEEDYTPTVFDTYSMKVPINNELYTLVLQDTAGQEEFSKLRLLAYKETDVFILCYAIDNYVSMENARDKWAPELRKFCPKAKLILAGTKCDLQKERTVPNLSGKKLSRRINADGFIENSAKEGRNIDETIIIALTAIVNSATVQNKKSCVCM